MGGRHRIFLRKFIPSNPSSLPFWPPNRWSYIARKRGPDAPGTISRSLPSHTSLPSCFLFNTNRFAPDLAFYGLHFCAWSPPILSWPLLPARVVGRPPLIISLSIHRRCPPCCRHPFSNTPEWIPPSSGWRSANLYVRRKFSRRAKYCSADGGGGGVAGGFFFFFLCFFLSFFCGAWPLVACFPHLRFPVATPVFPALTPLFPFPWPVLGSLFTSSLRVSTSSRPSFCRRVAFLSRQLPSLSPRRWKDLISSTTKPILFRALSYLSP